MTNIQSFRAGFLTKLAAAGLTPSQFMDKLAATPFLGEAFREGASSFGTLAALGLIAAAATPPIVAGVGGGKLLAAINAPTDSAVDEEQDRALRDHYKRLSIEAAKIKARAAASNKNNLARSYLRASAV